MIPTILNYSFKIGGLEQYFGMDCINHVYTNLLYIINEKYKKSPTLISDITRCLTYENSVTIYLFFLALLALSHFSLHLFVAVLRLHQVYFDAPTCKGGKPERIFLVGDYSSSAEFFVTIGVFTFLYSMAALSVYCFLLEKYRENAKGCKIVSLFMPYTYDTRPCCWSGVTIHIYLTLFVVKVIMYRIMYCLADPQDFVVSAVFAFMWLVSSCAWAKGLSDVKTATDPEKVIAFIEACEEQENRCREVYDPKVSGLNTSVVGP